MSKEEETIEIEEPVEEVEEVEFDTEGLSNEEVERAKEHGLVKEEPKEEESEDQEEEEESEEELQNALEILDDKGDLDLEAIEEAERNKKLNPLSDKERAFLGKFKVERAKRQSAYKKVDIVRDEFEKLKAEHDLGKIKDKVASTKLERIKELLRKDELTVGDIESVLNEEIKAEVKAEEPKKEDNIARLQEVEKSGIGLYPNFNEMTQTLVKELPAKEQRMLALLINDPQTDAVDVVETIKEKYDSLGKDREVNPKVKRMVKNASKSVKSASVASNKSGKRTVSYDDITPEMAARMSADQWQKLPDKVKNRIKKQLV